MSKLRIFIALLSIVAILIPGMFPVAAQEEGIPEFAPDPVVGGTLDPLSIPQFVDALPIVGVMPKTSSSANLDYYEIAVRQFQQQVLSSGMPKTTIWGYGSVNHPGTFNYPAYTIEAEYNKPVRVKWINGLVDKNNNFLPHLLPIDQTLHWANPVTGPDMAGTDPNVYSGPVPMVAHLHGAHVTQDSDGFPEAWFLPAASNIAGYVPFGSKYAQFKAEAEAAYGQTWEPGTAVFQYPNDQRAATLWFHDHSLGMTRANVYAGPAGFYLLRGGDDDIEEGLPEGAYEIPLVIQDKSFNKNGSLFYPKDRAFFEGLDAGKLKIPFAPDSDIAPIWNPEFFGNTMVVNGKTWPYLTVEQKQYRFRLLNASDSRFVILKLSDGTPIWQIGNDGGFLAAPEELDQVLLGPAERADVIIDFSGVAAGTEIILENIGPDEPFGGGEPGVDFSKANQDTTGNVMQFKVVAAVGADPSTPAGSLVLPVITPISGEPEYRYLSLNELMSETVYILLDENGDPVLDDKGNLRAVPAGTPGAEPFGPQSAMLGTDTEEIGGAEPMPWSADVTEQPVEDQTEIWVIRNYTADAHPIHLHQIQFEIIKRIDQFGNETGPDAGESGFKDTVIIYPGDEGDNPGITIVKVKFDIPGLFVWHCHILSHEDNEMMRPIEVLEAP